ncbi:MAG TPA: sigma 54-interacting transcriptional regulator [Thermoanaerobaculia bacterium]|nr:sigma 54-interacting transcriptional regulator [Thermoanaerobaculia bacterium]
MTSDEKAPSGAAPMRLTDPDAALRRLVEITAPLTGQRFFETLVESLACILDVHGAWVTELLPGGRRLRALAFWSGGQFIHDFEYSIAGTPCEAVIVEGCLVNFAEGIADLFPADEDIKRFHAVGYIGAPLLGSDGQVLGNLAVLDTRPLPEEPRMLTVFQLFAERAAAELLRVRAAESLQDREERLAALVDGAMDAIVELNPELRVVRANPAAQSLFGLPSGELVGSSFERFLSEPERERFARLRGEIGIAGRRSLWIPGGMVLQDGEGRAFPAEATLSRIEVHGAAHDTLILRNVNDRVEAERRIQELTGEAEYLREEVWSSNDPNEMLGKSAAMLEVRLQLAQVGPADTTVLILGETGTGKELVAQAVHGSSPRRTKALIKVNCAAIPATLIESEFFGHERGAFTGATARREGRFALADGGSIFLDEIGELPLDLQPKLLRVLQDGEFEPVGGSRTRRVDVRVMAATNRDLEREVAEGRFREDLYYRLNVFPIRVPPLRERQEDIAPLATSFARRFARKLGRPFASLSLDEIGRLRSYGWPGNVRELQNVIERALVVSAGGRLDLDRALPVPGATRPLAPESDASEDRVWTDHELREKERANVLRALEQCRWRVSGKDGAASVLGMKPSTLTSRLKALKIRRPAPGGY